LRQAVSLFSGTSPPELWKQNKPNSNNSTKIKLGQPTSCSFKTTQVFHLQRQHSQKPPYDLCFQSEHLRQAVSLFSGTSPPELWKQNKPNSNNSTKIKLGQPTSCSFKTVFNLC
jgi:hypothetical protein